MVGSWSAELVEKGLAACVQRERITSVYSWEETTQSSEEWRLEIKTSADTKDQLIEVIISNHPYETPQIVAWEASSTPRFSDWVQG
jgi:periplasmic divalent cation tolerance protein